MHAVARFPATLTSFAASRSWLATALRHLAPSAVVNDAQLCLSELAINAVDHARSGFEVEVDHVGDRVRIGVSDTSGDQPVLQLIDPLRSTGRGLLIVDAVAERWGVTPLHPAGRSVWCEQPATGAP